MNLFLEKELLNKVIDNNIVLIGEVGLGGEVRSVGNIEKRVQEAGKLGFNKVIIPQTNLKGLKDSGLVEVLGVENLTDAINNIMK